MGIALPMLETRPVRTPRVSPPPAPREARRNRQLIDSHGRVIRDLRLSLTDRCNFRCVYCMEPEVRFMPRGELLSADELVRVARIAESLGVRKIRLTGGEPTVRGDLVEIIRAIRRATAVELAMITNGSLLDRRLAVEWKDAGLDRITISIDSVDPDRFTAITRSSASVAEVFAGIGACIEAGLTPLKLNAVLLRGVNDDEAVALAGLARRFGVEMRFIEYMPLDSAHAWDRTRFVPSSETRARIEACYPLVPTGEDAASSTAVTYLFADGCAGSIGFIAPVSNPFCGACSRLRVTADGKVRPCLFSTTEWDLRPLLRDGSPDDAIADFLIDATWTKQAGHNISSPEFIQPERPMSAIGG